MPTRILGTDLRKLGAEFIGTFALVFAGVAPLQPTILRAAPSDIWASA